MHPREIRLFRAVAMCTMALALLVTSAGPAFAQGLLVSKNGQADIGPAAMIDGGVELNLMPMGVRLTNSLNEDTNPTDYWAIPLHGASNVTVTLRSPSASIFGVELYDPVSEVPVASGTGDDIQTLSYTTPHGVAQWYTLVVYSIAGSGGYTLDYSFGDPPADANTVRLAGTNRYGTAIEISKSGWTAGSSNYVVLATGANFPDALAASGLAGSYGCPLLLTQPKALPAEVLAEIDRLDGAGNATVFIIGSTAAVSDAVKDALVGAGKNVDRVQGVDRYATAAEIARRIKQHEESLDRPFSGKAFVAKGGDFPDALAVSPYAYSQRMPILLTRPTELPPSTRDAFGELGITSAYVAGSSLVVGDPVYNSLPVSTKERWYGADRYATALAVTNNAVGKGWASWRYVGLATGRNFPDALGGGVLCGKQGGVLMLSQPQWNTTAVYNTIQGHRSSITAGVRLFGGTSTLSSCAFGDYDWALYSDTESCDWVF